MISSKKSLGMSISSIIIINLTCSFIIHTLSLNPSFTPRLRFQTSFRRKAFSLHIYAPPGSGYYRPEDEASSLPQTYEPMMEYPGTMRPGRTKENQPYSSLPIADSDPDPVPWPHFQEIEWHHQWEPPHEHPLPMEEFIEMEGRWATAEIEAEMRVGARRGVRERREMEETEKSSSSFILDDDEDEDEDQDGPTLDLGQGVEILIGSKASSGTAEAKRKPPTKSSTKFTETEDEDDDFLLDLGLGDDDIDVDIKDTTLAGRGLTDDDAISADDLSSSLPDPLEDDATLDMKFDDFDLDFGDEASVADDINLNIAGDVDADGADEDVQLDEFVGNEDVGDDDNYDDGGYDYGYDYNDYDSGGSDNFS